MDAVGLESIDGIFIECRTKDDGHIDSQGRKNVKTQAVPQLYIAEYKIRKRICPKIFHRFPHRCQGRDDLNVRFYAMQNVFQVLGGEPLIFYDYYFHFPIISDSLKNNPVLLL